MDFKAVPRTISDTLTLKRKYVIPRFQREYSWEKDELDELWEDLLNNLKVENGRIIPTEYFIGSLVLVGDDDDTKRIERQVVDGQQRLMTFTIAFAAISQQFKDIGENKLSELVYKYIVNEDENGNLITKVVSESPKPFFQYRIQQREIDFSQEPHTAEERRILEAYNFFEEHLREDNLKKDISKRFDGAEFNYIDLLKLIRDQILNCKVIYVTVAEFSEAYEIFEVLNAKGKNLDPIDIIKNNLFSMLQQTEPIDRAQEKWMQIKNNITEGDVDDIQTFYRHYWISKYSKSTSKNLVREFDKLIPKTSERYEAFMMELVEASKDYMRLTKPLPQQWPQPEDREIYNALNALNIFGVTQPRSFILALLDARRRDIINHKKLLEIINFIQYFHFVFTAVCSARPSGLEAKYSKYARLLRQCTTKQESAEYVNCLKGELSAILPTYYQFEQDFNKIIFFSTADKEKKVVQYILKKIEEYIRDSNEFEYSSFSIEHILPESTHHLYAGKIGNLLPLGVELNCKIDNKDFSAKIKDYKCSSYETTKQFAMEHDGETQWGESQIQNRTNVLAKMLYYRNKIPKE